MGTVKRRIGALATVVVAAALVLAGGPALAIGSSHHSPRGYTCTGGEITSGDYASITVTGECTVPSGAVINVAGSVKVKAGAQLDAQTSPSTITVGNNVTAAAGSLLGLGCQPPEYTGNSAHVCAEPDEAGHSTITVNGNVTAIGSAVVLLNGITVDGNVTVIGGGSEFIPWSIKNNTIGRNLTIRGQTTNWLGALFNTVGGNAKLVDITLTEDHPGASQSVYIVRNNVGRNLICLRLAPGVSGGFVPGSVNVVGGRAIGQCASLV